MKIKLIIILFIILILGGLILFAVGKIDFSIWPPELKKEQIIARQTILSRSFNLMELSTAEGIYRAVFPFDFIPEEIDIKELNERKSSPGTAPLTKQEEYWLSLSSFCPRKGLWPESRKPRFVVITIVLKAGVEGVRTEGDGDYNAYFKEIFSPDWDNRVLIVDLPPVTIVDTVIEDPTPQNYPYPDIALTPEEWKMISSYVAYEIEENLDHTELLSRGQENLYNILNQFLSDTWWKDVVFVSQKKEQ